MKFLFITGALWPERSHNANLLLKLIPFMKDGNEIRLLSFASRRSDTFPDTVDGVPVYLADPGKLIGWKKGCFRVAARIADPHGYSDSIMSLAIQDAAKRIRREYAYDAVITCSEPFVAANATRFLARDVRKLLYIMDPPDFTWNHPTTPYREKKLKPILDAQDVIFATKYAKQALCASSFAYLEPKIEEVAFPMIEAHTLHPSEQDIKMDPAKINVLFCGAMSTMLKRSPKHYFELASYLDERFCLYFMGDECENLEERFGLKTGAQVVAMGRKPYETALNAMFSTDILVNIGNDVRVHLPSKIIEYISIGKPIVNFYKFDLCPTLDYARRYPLCLNIDEQTPVTRQKADEFIRFCTEAKGKTVPLRRTEKEFAECTPQYIAQRLLARLAAK